MSSLSSSSIRASLLSMQDTAYRDFQARLIPTIDKATVIGVRVPYVRRLSKTLFKSEGYASFIKELPHAYYDENILHALIIEQIKDFKPCIEAVERFLPFIDNWAVCDILNPKCLADDLSSLEAYIDRWLLSEHNYTVRFAIKLLMTHFLGDSFSLRYPEKVALVRCEEYYVKMAVA